MRTIWVHCYRDESLLRSSDFRVPETLNDAAVAQPTARELEDQAKTNLANERLAFPPYSGITLEIEYPTSRAS
jgi:hypothetical protein